MQNKLNILNMQNTTFDKIICKMIILIYKIENTNNE